jgi:SAM-dependent methyltransferase
LKVSPQVSAVPPSDALRPAAGVALAAWAARVRADKEQVERLREVADPADFYAPVAQRFRHDPRRTDDAALNVLRELCRPDDVWLDIGAGGGRYALPIALRTREVVCVEPSAGMIEVLRQGMGESGISNVRILEGRWPLPAFGDRADVSLMAHVGYDIEEIGPFLEAMEAATQRTCVAVLGKGAMTTTATLFWAPIHGEPRVALPALPELLTLLLARGRLPEVQLVDREPPTFDTLDDLLSMARRQLWVRSDSAKDVELQRLVRDVASARDGRWALDWRASKIGVVTWEPAAS